MATISAWAAAITEPSSTVSTRYPTTSSVRPGVTTSLTNDDGGERGVAVLAPVTYDFNGNGNRRVQPFIGAGAGVTTGDGTNLEVVATAGTDVRLGNRYVLNGSVNYLPLDGQRVDVAAGLGYRFLGFELAPLRRFP